MAPLPQQEGDEHDRTHHAQYQGHGDFKRHDDRPADEVTHGHQRNAEQALSLLRGAAIAQAQLQDADINGRKVWRLRIGPVSESATPELAARVVGLGFGQPQRVRD